MADTVLVTQSQDSLDLMPTPTPLPSPAHLLILEEEMMSKDDRGESNYENTFKNRTAGTNNKHRVHLGNCLTNTGSRPSGHVPCTSRLAEKMVNRDIQQHHAVDTHQIETKSGLYRKTTIQTIVPHEPKVKMNQQNHAEKISERVQEIVEKKQVQEICYLGEIDPRIWLGNVYCLNDPPTLQNKRIKHVIDFADEEVTIPQRIQHHRIKFHDSLSITNATFKQILQQTISIIDNIAPEENILIVCNAGINRSVAVIIGYAILKRSMSFKRALEIVENSKKDDQWYNLTNLRLLRLLREIQSSVPKTLIDQPQSYDTL